MKTFMTNGGNVLVFPERTTFQSGQTVSDTIPYFAKPNGEFIREVSQSEAEYVASVALEFRPVIAGEFPEYLIENIFPPMVEDISKITAIHPVIQRPVWHKITSIKVMEDYSCYKWETCNNGGDYAFFQSEDWYVAKFPNGEWKFASLTRYGTSAEFSYDELMGSFQQDLGTLYLSNVENCSGYYSQAGIEWDEEEKFYTSQEVLEKMGMVATFKDLWHSIKTVIDSPDEETGECTEFFYPALSLQDKKEIITRLKELGIEKTKAPRGNRGGGGKRKYLNRIS